MTSRAIAALEAFQNQTVYRDGLVRIVSAYSGTMMGPNGVRKEYQKQDTGNSSHGALSASKSLPEIYSSTADSEEF
jgi:hypothetical protein